MAEEFKTANLNQTVSQIQQIFDYFTDNSKWGATKGQILAVNDKGKLVFVNGFTSNDDKVVINEDNQISLNLEQLEAELGVSRDINTTLSAIQNTFKNKELISNLLYVTYITENSRNYPCIFMQSGDTETNNSPVSLTVIYGHKWLTIDGKVNGDAITVNSDDSATYDLSEMATVDQIPTKVSDLDNDQDYIRISNITVNKPLAKETSGDGNKAKLELSHKTAKKQGTEGLYLIKTDDWGHIVSTSKPKKITVGSEEYELGKDEIEITAETLGLSGALRFIGTTTTEIKDGSTTNKVKIGDKTITVAVSDVVHYNGKEFVWLKDKKWEELGDESSFALKTVRIDGKDGLTGGGNLTSNIEIKHADTSTQESITANGRTYITGVELDKFGHVTGLTTGTETLTQYYLPVAASDILGGVKSGGDVTINTDGIISVNDNSHLHTIENITGLQDALNSKSDNTHNHDSIYSKISHNHDTVYSKLDHNHSNYATTNHDHDTVYVKKNADITGSTKCKITYDAKGLIISGADLTANDIPNLTASKIIEMTGYTKPTTTSAIAASDSLNVAIGKLEKALDSKGTSNLTIGTTASTAAAGNHNHNSTYASITHSHSTADITGYSNDYETLKSVVNGKVDAIPGKGLSTCDYTLDDQKLLNDLKISTVRYDSDQNLSDAQKIKARNNIGAGTSSFTGDYNALANKPTIPTKTSQLTNDSGFVTGSSGKVNAAVTADKLSVATLGSSTQPVYFNEGVPTTCTNKIPTFRLEGNTLYIEV